MPYMDSQNAERLVHTYADTILRISYMYLKQTCDAEDICQTVFLKLLSRELAFASPDHERAWVIRATINACKDMLRTAFWKRAIELEHAGEIAAPQAPETALMELVNALPKNYRISIYLYYYEGYPVREIAEMLGKSENVISAYLSRGRKRLKAAIEGDDANSAYATKGAV